MMVMKIKNIIADNCKLLWAANPETLNNLKAMKQKRVKAYVIIVEVLNRPFNLYNINILFGNISKIIINRKAIRPVQIFIN